MKRPINERIEDGIELLKVVVNSIIQNRLQKIDPEDILKLDILEYASRAYPNKDYSYKCTRDLYLFIEKTILTSYKGRFYRHRTLDSNSFKIRNTKDDSSYLRLMIMGDRNSNTDQRVEIRFTTEKDGDNEGILSIYFDDGAGFLGNKIYGTQIKSLLNRI